jgi:hypothetical protein
MPLVYCDYCKGEIYDDEELTIINNRIYHTDCYQQMNNSVDSFGDSIYYDEEDEEAVL